MFKTLLRWRSSGRLTTFMFHRVPLQADALRPDELTLDGFERFLDRIAPDFRVLPLSEALLGLRAGNLPAGAACLTFDDGYADWLQGVVPLLERRSLHATFFITSGQFSGTPVWTERLAHAVASAGPGCAALTLGEGGGAPIQVPLRDVAQRRLALELLDRHLKYQPIEQRETALASIERQCGVDRADVRVMSSADLRTLHAKGFGIGGHSVTHPILSTCTPEQAYQEIGGCREQLASIVAGRVDAFAYPNGIPGVDYGADHVRMVQRAGYQAAVSTHWGAATGQTPLFQIPRFTPWGPGAVKTRLQLLRNLGQRPRTVAEPPDGRRRVLMVAFHFPPQSGSSGILRTLNFVKNLPQHGWQPQVLTAAARAYVEQRNDLVASIPPDVAVHRGFALDAARHLSIRGKYPRVLALPDRWSSWWLGAVFQGWRTLRREPPDVIWSTYPLSTAHAIGASLARWSGRPWVADFRDPMVSTAYPAEPLLRAVWQRIEQRVMHSAALCVFTTQRAAQTYAARYPQAAARCVVIENGYDESAFEGVTPERGGLPPDTLLLLHSGLIYPQDRNPSAFFQALQAMLEAGELRRDRVRVRFRAPHHANEVVEFARRCGVEDLIEVAPPIPYRQAIAEMMGADVLLLFQGSHFNAQVPAKVYEYLRAQRQLLAAVDPEGDTARLLSAYRCVAVASIDDATALRVALGQVLSGLTDPSALQGFARNREQVMQFSRAVQAQRLAGHLDRLREAHR